MTNQAALAGAEEMIARIRTYSFEEYADRVRSFHGYEAVGVIIGGFMVDLACRHFPEGMIYDAISETPKCLPDAIQLLTPCTTGNGWLTVVNLGRYALTFYDKVTGEGVRVFVDPARLDSWPEIKSWFFKLKPKKEQDELLLMKQVRDAGAGICGIRNVTVALPFLQNKRRGGFAVCPRCGEGYPVADGRICLGCREQKLYEHETDTRVDAREET